MININHEGPKDVWDEKDEHINGTDLSMEEKEDNLSLHEYLIMREKLEVKKLELADLNQDEMVKNMLIKIDDEIKKLNDKIVELGGEIEVKA